MWGLSDQLDIIAPRIGSLFNAGQEPPMGEMRDDSKRQNELGVAYEPQAKEGGSAHTSFGIVEESVNTSIG